MRAEFAQHRIAFTLVNPGSINTPFTDQWPEQPRQAHNQESMSMEESIVPILVALNAQYNAGSWWRA